MFENEYVIQELAAESSKH